MNTDETITMTRKELNDRMQVALDMFDTYIFDYSPIPFTYDNGEVVLKYDIKDFKEKYYDFVTNKTDVHLERIKVIMADDELYEIFKDGDAWLHGDGHYFLIIGDGDHEMFTIEDKSLLVALKRYLGWSGVEAWAYRKDDELPKSYFKINKEEFDKAVPIIDYILLLLKSNTLDDINEEDILLDKMDKLWYALKEDDNHVLNNIIEHLKQQGRL